jgi:HlyD family secretion protein
MTIVRGLRWAPLALVFSLVMVAAARSDDGPGKPPSTVKVTKAPIKIETTLKGVVEAEHGAEISIRPEVWASPLTILKAVEHGTTVKKGDVLVEIDPEKIDQAIKDSKIDRELSDMTLQQAIDELPLLEKLLPLDLIAAERANKQADEDLKKFVEVDRAQSEKSAHFMVKNSKHFLDYAREELTQLQKMYRSKDLTEETEEMILKRQRNQVESAEFQLQSAEIRRDATLNVELPRQAERVREGAIRQALGWERAKITLPMGLSQKRVALVKMKIEKERSAEKLARLEKDREAMTVKAPVDGIVYYGKALGGGWSGASMLIPRLRKGGAISPSEVFMTVVEPRPVFVRATADEKDLHTLHQDLKGKAIAAGYPDRKIPARLVQVSPIPQGPGSFEARVSLDSVHVEGAGELKPGMACSIQFVSYRNDDALTVPSASVFEDNDEMHYVYDKNGSKRGVKVGKTVGGKVEILDGLKEGDEILSSRP